MDSVCVQRSGHHDGQLSCDFADQRLRYINIALHGLLHIFPVGIILAIENTDAVHADNISPLEVVHGTAFVYDGFFLLGSQSLIG